MNINITNILNGTYKILSVANKTIPLIKDITPSISKVKNIIKGKPKLISIKNEKINTIKKIPQNVNPPNFFK